MLPTTLYGNQEQPLITFQEHLGNSQPAATGRYANMFGYKSWICDSSMLGKSEPNILSQMVGLFHGDKSHGIESVKKK